MRFFVSFYRFLKKRKIIFLFFFERSEKLFSIGLVVGVVDGLEAVRIVSADFLLVNVRSVCSAKRIMCR
jgi:hypothetical protein